MSVLTPEPFATAELSLAKRIDLIEGHCIVHSEPKTGTTLDSQEKADAVCRKLGACIQ